MGEILDLLGDPIPDGFGRRGRPPHIPTGENRNKVRMLLAFGWEEPRISRALRISPPTLRKHYFRELRHADEARDALDAALIATTMREALAGNASMMKEARKILDRHDLDMLGSALDRLGKAGREPKLGKKDQALLDASAPDPTTSMGEMMARRMGKVTKRLDG